MKQQLTEIAQKRQKLEEEPKLTSLLKDAFWWDEMFFTLGKVSWCLLLIVNAKGEPIVWSFGHTRTKEDYCKLIEEIGDQLPEVPIFIGDAWSAYQKTCKELGRECYLIEHVHSHPWKNVRLHHFVPDPQGTEVLQTSLEIPYSGFIRNCPIKGKAFQRIHQLPDPTKTKIPRGRPKGAKDQKKRQPKKKNLKKVKNKKTTKRGPKSLSKDGRTFHCHPNPLCGGWHIEWSDPPLTTPNLTSPSLSAMENLLDLTYRIMKGRAIQSNIVEGVNREIRAILPNRGLKTPDQTKTYIDLHLSHWRGDDSEETEIHSSHHPVTSSRAFTNLFTYFTPNTQQIEIATTSLFSEVYPRF